jgi:hypothetical protein
MNAKRASLIATAALAACSGHPRVEGMVDPHTGLLQSVTAWAPRSDFQNGTPYFMVQSPSGTSTYWDAAQTQPDGGLMRASLTLRGDAYRPAVGESVWIYAIDHVSGKEDLLGILKVASKEPQVLTNADFATWPSGNVETTAPVGWRIAQRGASSIARLPSAGIRLVAIPVKGGSSVVLNQNLQYAGGAFRARIRSTVSCVVADGKISEFFGLTISDDRGETAMFCVGNQSRETVTEVGALRVVDILPGRPGPWLSLSVDASSPTLAPYARFNFGKEHPLTIGVEADANGSRTVLGDLDGIQLGR